MRLRTISVAASPGRSLIVGTRCLTFDRPVLALLGVDRECVQRSLPEFPVLIEPGVDRAEGLGVQDAPTNAPVHLPHDESRTREHLQVSRDRGERDGKWRRELGDGLGSTGKASEDSPAGRVAEGTKYEIEPSLDGRTGRAQRAAALDSYSAHRRIFNG
jgi:hypothetical protein